MRAMTVVAACLVIAGCLAPPASIDPRASYVLAPATGDPAAPPTLDRAPEWVTGEWWTYRFTSDSQPTEESTRVVAGIDGGLYVVGMPRDAWDDAVLSTHLPAFGDVRRSDLAFEVHDGMYLPLRFPLREGDSWDAYFEFGNVTLTVERVDGTRATILQTAPEQGRFEGRIVYDAALREVVHVELSNYGTLEMIDHGYGWTGVLRAPRNQGIAFIDGRFAGALTRDGAAVDPRATADVGETWDALALTLGVGPSRLAAPASPGAARATAVAPDGTTYEITRTVADGGAAFTTFGHTPAEGTWNFEFIAAGWAQASAEGFAYEIHDVDIPSMRVTRPPR